MERVGGTGRGGGGPDGPALRSVGYEVINLGGGQPVTMAAVIEQIARLVGKSPRVEQRPMHKADVPATWADISKARECLRWFPEIGMEEGLRRSVAWYRENRQFVLGLELGTP